MYYTEVREPYYALIKHEHPTNWIGIYESNVVKIDCKYEIAYLKAKVADAERVFRDYAEMKFIADKYGNGNLNRDNLHIIKQDFSSLPAGLILVDVNLS